MEITVELPDNLTERPDPSREALEALAIAGYRSGKLTAFQTRCLLGFTSRFEFDGFLKERGIEDHAYSSEDLAEDVKAMEKLGIKTGRQDLNRA